MLPCPRVHVGALKRREQLIGRRHPHCSLLRAVNDRLSSYPPVAGSQLRLLQPIQVDDGVDRPLLLYLPGMDGTGQAILPQIPSLMEAGLDVRCLYIPPEDRCTWDQLVAQTCHLLSEALGSSASGRSGAQGEQQATSTAGTRAVIVGESFGGCLALRIAAAAPELVQRLVLINPATSFNNSLGGLPALVSSTNLLALFPDQLYAIAQGVMLPLLVDSDRAGMIGAEAMKSMITMTPPMEIYSDGTTAPSAQRRGQSVFSAAAQAANWRSNLLREPGLSDSNLANITTQTLVVVGARDRLFPSIAEGARLQRVMKRARRLILPDSAHALLLESSVDLAAIMTGAGFMPKAPEAARVPRSRSRELLKPLLERSAEMRRGGSSTGAAQAARPQHPQPERKKEATPTGARREPPPAPQQQPAARAAKDISVQLRVVVEEPGTILTFTSLRETARAVVEGNGLGAAAAPAGGSEAEAGPATTSFSQRPGDTGTAVNSAGSNGTVAAASGNGTGGAAGETVGVSGSGAVLSPGSARLGSDESTAGMGDGPVVQAGASGRGLGAAAPPAAPAYAASAGVEGTNGTPASQAGAGGRGLGAVALPAASASASASPVNGTTGAPATAVEAEVVGEAAGAVNSKWDEWSQILVPWRELISPVVRGVENLPDISGAAAGRPVLFVGNHGKFGLYDTPLLALELYLRGFQVKGLAHPGHWLGPMGPFFEQFGAVKASPLAAYRLLKGGKHVLLFPGGAREVHKRRGEDYQLFWKETPDFVRLAAKTQAIIVPFAAVGADDAYDVAMDPEEILQHPVLGPLVQRALQPYSDTMEPKDAVPPMPTLPGTRFPSLLPLPNLQRLYFKFMPPVDTALAASAVGVGRRRRGAAGDEAAATALYGEVRRSVEAGLQELLEVRKADEETQVGSRLQKAASRWFPALSMTQRLM